MVIKYRDFTRVELENFKRFQRQSYALLDDAAKELTAGMTEKQAAKMVRKRFHEQGVHSYFHVPVVLFGARTAYPGKFGQLEALATEQRLVEGMPVILDAAPIYDGYVVDTSLSTTFGENSTHRTLHPLLQDFRNELLSEVKKDRPFRDIAQHIDSMIQDLGAENCHKKHIGEVLGHRVYRGPAAPFSQLTIQQLSVPHVSWLLWKSIAAIKRWQDDTPNWNHRRTSGHPPRPGLWAVEPHFAVDGVGVKFEEIMVITTSDAHWLDDDLPHTRLWAAEQSSGRSSA